jgi:hypothetical protein
MTVLLVKTAWVSTRASFFLRVYYAIFHIFTLNLGMPTIVGKEAPSVTIYYYKGNAFSQDFLVSGTVSPDSAIAKIYRVGDPEKQALIQFANGQGLVISGQQIQLDKSATEMILPPGLFEFTMEGVVGGVHYPFVQRSMFIINDAIGQQLLAPAFIISTAISDTQVDVSWDFSDGAVNYVLRRSLDALNWSTVYTGPNAFYGDSGLTASTLYYYQVIATAPGRTDSPPVQTNTTTLAADGGGGGETPGFCWVPAGGNTADFLVKASDDDFDLEWVAFEEVPHDHDERYYTKDEIDGLGFGAGGVYTGTI